MNSIKRVNVSLRKAVILVLVFCLVLSGVLFGRAAKAITAAAEWPYKPTNQPLNLYAAGNHITLKEGTYIGYTNIYLDTDLNTFITPSNMSLANTSGYDLSDFYVCGSFSDGRKPASVSITMLGGHVDCLLGSAAGGSSGDCIVNVYGGVVDNTIRSGPGDGSSGSYTVGKSHIGIHGGIVNNVNCGGLNTITLPRDTCDIEITGGTIKKNITMSYVPDHIAKQITITGGTIQGNFVFSDSKSVTPTNGSEPVYRTVLQFPGISGETNVEGIVLLWGNAAGYGTKDMYTNANGELFMYLPQGTSCAYYKGGWYRSDVSSSVNVSNVFYPVDPNEYSIISGANSVWQLDSKTDLVFKANGEFGNFLGVEIGGTFIDKGQDYSAANGSTIITLENSYLKNLTVGIHEIRVVYRDGVAKTNFVVSDTEIPKTGDPNNFPLFLGIVAVSILGIIMTSKYIRKLRRC